MSCLVAVLSAAAGTNSDDSVPKSSTEDLLAVRAECTKNIQVVQQQLAAQREVGSAPPTHLLDELALWRQIDLVVTQRESVLQNSNLSRTTDTRPASDGITEFSELESAREGSAVKQELLESLALEIQSERSLLLQTRELLEESERDWRRISEQLLNAPTEQRADLRTQQRLEQLRVRLNTQRYSLHQDTIAEMAQRQSSVEKDLIARRERIAQASPSVRFTQADLDRELQRIAETERTVRIQIGNLDEQMHQVLTTPSQEESAATTTLNVIHEETQLLRQLLTEVAAVRECWKRRYKVFHQEATDEQFSQWAEESAEAQDRLAQIISRLAARTMQRRQQVVNIRRRNPQTAAERTTSAQQLAQLEAIIDAYGNLQLLAARAQRLYARFSEDLAARQGGFSIRTVSSWLGARAKSCWNLELTSVDDRSVTVGKLITALVLLIVGLVISKVASAIIAFRILPRFGFSRSAATTVRQMMMYVLVVGMAMLSLHMVNVPLTIFAFLGGAAAIGVGFGSQNTVANFISGVILLVQRPIRIGDLINADGMDANVEHIGARATRVRTSENVEVLIPNSKILHNNVINWTLSDTRIRTSITVGVAYGTPVRAVQETLQKVVTAHSKVIQQPEPIVLFENFGDSSLVFEVHFWIHMHTIMDGAIVRSEIRVAIDDAFRQTGIVIAFPQRDVHLDLQSPIEVSLSESGRSTARPRRAA